MVIGDILTNNSRLFPNKLGIIDGQTGVRYTWWEINERVNRLCNGLVNLGIQKGDRIGLISQNSLECGEFQFAIARIGAIGCGLNYRIRPNILAELINDAGIKVLFVQNTFSDVINGIKANLKTVEHFVGIGKNHPYPLDYDRCIQESPARELCVKIRDDDPLMICYTSGTTGIPKGVLVSHRNRMAYCLESCLYSERYIPEDVVSVSAPWCAGTAGQVQFLAPSLAGATVVIHVLGPQWVEVVEREKITVAMMTKSRFMPIWEHLQKTGQKYDLGSLKKVTLGAEPIQPEDIERIMKFCGVSYSAKAYGITETSACGARLLPHDLMAGFSPHATEREKKRLESVGKPLLSTRIRIVDEKGQDMSPGEMGEVIVKGDCVALGYWNNPELTKMRFRDGWYYTHDLGYFDEDGYLYLKGRKDYVIKTGGFLVSPIDVENAIQRHEAVKEVAVIGVPDEKWTEAVTAVVCLKEGYTATQEMLKEHCRQYLSGFQIPKAFLFIEKLPRNEAGRVQLEEIKKLLIKP